jgi:hypothetical protein
MPKITPPADQPSELSDIQVSTPDTVSVFVLAQFVGSNGVIYIPSDDLQEIPKVDFEEAESLGLVRL